MLEKASVPVIEAEGLGFRYSEAPTPVLDGITFRLDPCEWVGLLGPNGGGKTTLLRLLLGQLEPLAGRVRVLGQSPRSSRARIGYVPQVSGVDPTVPATVTDIVLLGRLSSGSWGPRWNPEDRDRAEAALDQTATLELAGREWRALSGGQRQRVLIARALASEVELLLLDEPTTGIDIHRERELLTLLERLNETLPILMVTHDMALVTHHMDRALWVDRTLREVDRGGLDPHSLEELFHRGRH